MPLSKNTTSDFVRVLFNTKTGNVKRSSSDGKLVFDFANFSGQLILTPPSHELSAEQLGDSSQGETALHSCIELDSDDSECNKTIDSGIESQSECLTQESPEGMLTDSSAPAFELETAMIVTTARNSAESEQEADETPLENSSQEHKTLNKDTNWCSLEEIQVDAAQVPQARWGATLTGISDTTLFLFGGEAEDENDTDAPMCDARKFNVETSTWETVLGNPGPKLSWHTATYIPKTNHVIVYGGNGPEGPCADAQVFDCDIDLWYPLTASGKSPGVRMGHTAVLLGDHLVVFGGNRGRKWLNDLFVLDTCRWRWSQPRVEGKAPGPRVFHSACAIDDNSMVVFGGNSPESCFNDVHVLRHSVEPSTGEVRWRWSRQRTVGVPPSPRCGHSSAFDHPSKSLFTFGGWDPAVAGADGGAEVAVFSDISKLDTTTWKWSHVSRPEEGGEFLTGHAGCIVAGVEERESLMYVFGGQEEPPECKRSNRILKAQLEAPEGRTRTETAPESSPKRRLRKKEEINVITPPPVPSDMRQKKDKLSSKKDSEKMLNISPERQVLAPRRFRKESVDRGTEKKILDALSDGTPAKKRKAGSSLLKEVNRENESKNGNRERVLGNTTKTPNRKKRSLKGNGKELNQNEHDQGSDKKKRSTFALELSKTLKEFGIGEDRISLAISAMPSSVASKRSTEAALNFVLEYLDSPACRAKSKRR